MRKLFILLLPCVMLLSACTANSVSWFPSYKIKVHQGNIVSEEQKQALQVGMTQQQVASIVGLPLLADAFHHNRWDYVHFISRNGVLLQHSDLTLYFGEDGLLQRIVPHGENSDKKQ